MVLVLLRPFFLSPLLSPFFHLLNELVFLEVLCAADRASPGPFHLALCPPGHPTLGPRGSSLLGPLGAGGGEPLTPCACRSS